MKIKNFAIALSFLLLNVGYTYAESSTTVDTKTNAGNSNAEVTEKPNVQNLQKVSTEQNELQPKVEGRSKCDTENFSLTFSNQEQPDTTNFWEIEYYIKNLVPLTKKSGYDSKSIEMMDVL